MIFFPRARNFDCYSSLHRCLDFRLHMTTSACRGLEKHGDSRHREAVKEARHIQNELNTNLCRETLPMACGSH
ncbi:hypothetical protein EYF80_040235 [Liparis tanakae]|uniref:Uncharacterized protein n=1 Tax=Liparis tanakae TaxID=230148 RepID=A0A4Z2G8T2_9TELE|nr:hypothetical protein EYF80_040235 [Liparis tanakae]